MSFAHPPAPLIAYVSQGQIRHTRGDQVNTFGLPFVEAIRVALTPLKILARSQLWCLLPWPRSRACPPQTLCLQRHDTPTPYGAFSVLALAVFAIAAAIMATTTGLWEQEALEKFRFQDQPTLPVK